jgi:hypothetical protein
MSSISKFNFTNWQVAQEIVESSSARELTKEEKHLLSAIKLAYFACEDGREIIVKKAAKTGAVFVLVISLITLISLTSQRGVTKTAEAKTFGERVNQIVESTMSAVLK